MHSVSSGSVTVNADSSVQLLAEEVAELDKLDLAVSVSFCLLSQTFCTMPKSSENICLVLQSARYPGLNGRYALVLLAPLPSNQRWAFEGIHP